MYHGLTAGAIASLLVKGSPEQQEKYVPKMVSGEWTGTMNLTEPHCGTDLGLLKTKAEPQADGSYRSRDQDLHLVRRARHGREHHPSGARQDHRRARQCEGHLAVRGAQVPGERGRSLGERNGVSCGSIEHKMGIHGNSTCVMNYDGRPAGWSASRRRAWPPCSS
jgi:alkylation response protein AidB-like acyl-CoA dehydrogenase